MHNISGYKRMRAISFTLSWYNIQKLVLYQEKLQHQLCNE